MSTWVVDASVAVEILLRTPTGDQAWTMIETGEVCCPDLLDAEVLSVLRKLALTKVISARRAEEALDDLADWEMERLSTSSLVKSAWRYRHNLSSYDAIYVAAARRVGATVITADGPLSRAPGVDVSIHNVRR